ncbi:hypothetical protein QYE76_019685 [Lolium multiflorum]|uniref:F-box associated domain-containing protein n=1 Tax=Lolium multiflorum TaxID=4521 RepID=A0AAD8VRG0_LOLMU|nr:hypothetical protein QYE76_019680 [Lolium multiflorum]KAK1614168.1 hypothetical protein QYE76_019685 [Lolium multiflorum]
MLTRAARRLLPASTLLAAALPLRRTYSSKVHGIFINYVDHGRPHLFARPTSSRTVDAMLDFLPDDDRLRFWWSVLDHSGGLLLCDMTVELCVCNPATRRWTLIPRLHRQREGKSGVYLAFDPAASPHYELIVVPAAPPGMDKPPFVDDDTSRRLLESEWPPTPWTLDVFSSRTGQWEERAFVRQGEPAGTVRRLRLHQADPICWGCQRYGVFSRGTLYVHCRGSFVLSSTRLLSKRLSSSHMRIDSGIAQPDKLQVLSCTMKNDGT